MKVSMQHVKYLCNGCYLTLTPPDGETCAVNLRFEYKMKICEETKICGINTPPTGEFIR